MLYYYFNKFVPNSAQLEWSISLKLFLIFLTRLGRVLSCSIVKVEASKTSGGGGDYDAMTNDHLI